MSVSSMLSFLTAFTINFVNTSTFCKVHKNATGEPVHVPLIIVIS